MKVRDLLSRLASMPLDADVLIEHYDAESSVPWHRDAYDPMFHGKVPYPSKPEQHPQGVVLL